MHMFLLLGKFDKKTTKAEFLLTNVLVLHIFYQINKPNKYRTGLMKRDGPLW